MQRDKRGRFVKKASTGTNLTTPMFSLNDPLKEQKKALDSNNMLFGEESKAWAPKKIKYRWENGKAIDEYGNEINTLELSKNPHRYEIDLLGSSTTPLTTAPSIGPTGVSQNISTVQINGDNSAITEQQGNDESAGRNIYDDTKDKKLQLNQTQINRTKLADFLELTRAGIGASVNNKIADRALKAEKPLLQEVSESHRSVYGDYRAQIQGEKAAAQLRNLASKPLTSDGALQQQMMIDAQIKGQEYIDQGNAKDDAMRRQTQEVAWQQEKENQ